MIPLTKAQLLHVLDDIRARVAEEESFGGFLNSLLPEEGDPEETYARVEARYRFGNKDGQGFMRMIGVQIKKEGGA